MALIESHPSLQLHYVQDARRNRYVIDTDTVADGVELALGAEYNARVNNEGYVLIISTQGVSMKTMYAVKLTATTKYGQVSGLLTTPTDDVAAVVAARNESLDKLQGVDAEGKSKDPGFVQLVEGETVHILPPAVVADSILSFEIVTQAA